MNNQSFLPSVIAILSLFLVSFIAFIIVNLRAKKTNKKNYDIRHDFPFELNQNENKQLFLLSFLLLLIFALSGFIFYFITYNTASNYYTIMISAFGSLSFVMLVLLFMVSLDNLRGHFLVFIFYLLSLITTIVFIASMCFNEVNIDKWWIIGGIFVLLGIIILIIALNPKISTWSRLEKKEEKDGTIIYVRPKIVVLAISEWILIFIQILIVILSFILFLIK